MEMNLKCLSSLPVRSLPNERYDRLTHQKAQHHPVGMTPGGSEGRKNFWGKTGNNTGFIRMTC
jgi:hypothetical protein